MGRRQWKVKLSIVTSQPWIKGRDATQKEIDKLMTDKGFEKLNDTRFYHPGEGILVHDMKPRNVKFSTAGNVHPIDPVIQRVTPAFADFMRSYHVQS